jgi:catabolite regulation protein CreA
MADLAPLGMARADDLPCVSTTFRWMGPNNRVCVSAFDDPKVPGVACHISQARTGGIKGGLGRWAWPRIRRGSRSPAARSGRFRSI